MLVPVEWDSAFFGLRLGRVTAPVLDAGAAAAVVATGREQRFDCLSLLLPASDASSDANVRNTS